MFEIKDVDLAGRIGLLHTRSGTIETPAFFPVIDPLRQELPIEEIERAGFKQVITNAYLTLKRFGRRAVEEGIHGVLGFHGIIMTDSGAYQILEYGDIEASQEDVIRFQESIGSDIGVILDIPTGDVGREEARRSVEETLRRAREAASLISGSRTLWVLPVQGGRHLDLVEYSASESGRLEGYSIYGIGSPTVFLERYMYEVVVDIVYTAKRLLPGGRPVHLFGAGHPLIIPYAVALGVDTFDSASYILYARDGRYITDYGVERLDRLEYFPCTCPVCSRYTPGELREMEKQERTKLLALHNLYKIRESIYKTKQYIREGRLWELLEETSMKHHKARDAMTRLTRYAIHLARTDTRSKGIVRGIRLYTQTSLSNPKVLAYKSRATRLYTKIYTRPRYTLILEPHTGDCTKPSENVEVVYYKPFLGVIPWQLCGVYPTVQSHHSGELEKEVIEDLAGEVRSFLSTLGPEKPGEVIMVIDNSIPWSVEVSKLLGELDVKIVRRM
ncbi:MAG: tRNA guanosine(15) transglycosylase TgtA [Desulfurococcales archaeon]|nr:tRNA guanosine(15) transglycosylase TgtA [Desulfurococcales archaeon]MCE4605363.1 tRNA guanosine(15) transglycosylase TgtA [Desulfurococcales archaeon]